MLDDRECTKMYGDDLHQVIISAAYYGSCTRCDNDFVNYNQRNTAHLDERAPLVAAYVPARTWRFINIRIFTLGILFIGGISIGSFLLYEQGQPMVIHHIFEFVSREEWGARTLATGNRLHPPNVVHILVYQTGGRHCINSTDCTQLLKQMQSDSFESDTDRQELPFNFLIGGDGRIYEGRGWFTESGNPPIRKNKVLSVAFIGNFTTETPSKRQLSGGHALLGEIEFQKRVSPSYSLLGIRCLTQSRYDGAALFAELAKLKRWGETISIY